jgi:hypothetical protein
LLHVFDLNVYDGYGSDRLLYTQPVLPRRVRESRSHSFFPCRFHVCSITLFFCKT